MLCIPSMWHQLKSFADVPDGCNVRLAVIDGNGTVHALVFPCRRVGNSWIDSKLRRRSRWIRPIGRNGRKQSDNTKPTKGVPPALPGRQQKFDISRSRLPRFSWTGLQTVSHQAHERVPPNGVATRSKATRLQMDGLPESEVRMSEKHTRFLGRHCAMRVGVRIDAARTSRFERLQS